MRLIAPKDYPTSLDSLCKALDEAGIKYTIRDHPVAAEGVKEAIGYNPAGDEQVLIEGIGENLYSVIRGFVSFGAFEIMQIDGVPGSWWEDVERFTSPAKLIKALKEEESDK